MAYTYVASLLALSQARASHELGDPNVGGFWAHHCNQVLAMASNLVEMASNVLAVASTLLAGAQFKCALLVP